MGRKSAITGPKEPPKKRKRSPTAGRKSKPWRDRNRLDLLPLEPAIAKMVVMRTPVELIAAWVRRQGQTEGPDGQVVPGPYAATTDEQVAAMDLAIRARWRAVQDDPETVKEEASLHAAMLNAAIHDAWNRPVMVFTKDEGWVPLKNPDGTAAVQVDHKALPAYLREHREFYGFGAPQKHAHVHLHGQLAPPVALSPADREAELRALLERRAAHLKAAGQPVIDVPPPALPAPAPAKRKGG